MDRLESLTERLKEHGNCEFRDRNNIIVRKGTERDFLYEIYRDSGEVLDGGVFDGTAKECIEFVLSDLKEK